MDERFVSHTSLPEFVRQTAWDGARTLKSFDLEITPRCNNNCRHCYINMPAGDEEARRQELSLTEIERIAQEAVDLGALWCLVTGGEPLLRRDFADIYVGLKRKGLLVSLFTNATLVGPEHVRLLKDYPPRDVEVSVYGVTQDTYERVTRRRGSFDAFMRGIDLLMEGGVKVRLKAVVLRSNVHEFQEMARFCRERTRDYFRFDPFLHLRYDGDATRNSEIAGERLSPREIVDLERSDEARFSALTSACDRLVIPESAGNGAAPLLRCGAGNNSVSVSYDGLLRLCSSLCHPDCVYDLRTGSMADAWRRFVPRVRAMRSGTPAFLRGCGACRLVNLCMWCPAHAHLEVGQLDVPVGRFCEMAQARAEAILGPERPVLPGGRDRKKVAQAVAVSNLSGP